MLPSLAPRGPGVECERAGGRACQTGMAGDEAVSPVSAQLGEWVMATVVVGEVIDHSFGCVCFGPVSTYVRR